MKIIIINGPNLNLLGKREPEVYGNQTFEDFFEKLKQSYSDVDIDYFQSYIEGELVDKLQEVGFSYDGIILNAASYTHTSIDFSDAIAAINTPVLEVHISNIYAREEFRHKSIITGNCVGMISGLGLAGYTLALNYFVSNAND